MLNLSISYHFNSFIKVWVAQLPAMPFYLFLSFLAYKRNIYQGFYLLKAGFDLVLFYHGWPPVRKAGKHILVLLILLILLEKKNTLQTL